MIFEINKIDSRKLPLKSLQSKSKARRSHPWLFQSLSKPQVYLVTRFIQGFFFTTMNINDYQIEAMRTLNPELNKKDILINSVMGLCGESGEAIDIVKKWLMQGHDLDKNHLIKELGDIAWYLAEAATALDVPLDTILEGNLDKLHKKYPDGFNTSASINRQKED